MHCAASLSKIRPTFWISRVGRCSDREVRFWHFPDSAVGDICHHLFPESLLHYMKSSEYCTYVYPEATANKLKLATKEYHYMYKHLVLYVLPAVAGIG